MKWLDGWEWSSGEPFPSGHRPNTFICKVPDELGRVTRLEVRNGRVFAQTESGIDFIVPLVPQSGDV